MGKENTQIQSNLFQMWTQVFQSCRTFVKDEVEFEIVLRQEAGEDRRRAEWEKEKENALIEKKDKK